MTSAITPNKVTIVDLLLLRIILVPGFSPRPRTYITSYSLDPDQIPGKYSGLSSKPKSFTYVDEYAG